MKIIVIFFVAVIYWSLFGVSFFAPRNIMRCDDFGGTPILSAESHRGWECKW